MTRLKGGLVATPVLFDLPVVLTKAPGSSIAVRPLV